MSNVRELLENHQPIVAHEVGERSDLVAISQDDLRQLMILAHEAVHPASNAAAEVIRGMLNDEDTNTKSTEPEEKDEGPSLPSMGDEQIRLHALHYAVQLDSVRVQAAHGLDSNVSDPAKLANEFYLFLAGK